MVDIRDEASIAAAAAQAAVLDEGWLVIATGGPAGASITTATPCLSIVTILREQTLAA